MREAGRGRLREDPVQSSDDVSAAQFARAHDKVSALPNLKGSERQQWALLLLLTRHKIREGDAFAASPFRILRRESVCDYFSGWSCRSIPSTMTVPTMPM